ncbi:hypothetical protein Fot_04458 [Forsythia ovata]|uniref:Uncharacterized protein n=1 Tax=Forsythia ovata TaxID=205694 RepID=A0ABD1XCM0_9LAMI
MDIDDRYFDDLDLDDEADNHLPKVSTILVRNSTIVSHGRFSFLQDTCVQDKRMKGCRMKERTLPPRLLILSTGAYSRRPLFLTVVEVVGTVSSFSPTLGTASIPAATDLPMTGVVGSDLSSLPFKASVRPSKDVDHQGKEKGVAVDEGENVAPKRTLGDEGDATGSARFKKGQMAYHQETARSIPASPSTVHVPIPYSSDWIESINIGSRQDELDLAILEKLPPSSVYNNWTSVWARATESADLLELIKMAEINTAQSHVLNCKVYKMPAMKVLHARLAIVKDARAQALFQLTKSQTIQRMCADAQRKAKLKLKVFEDMAYAKHKELNEVLTKLSKAKELLAKLGAPGHADLRRSVETQEL